MIGNTLTSCARLAFGLRDPHFINLEGDEDVAALIEHLKPEYGVTTDEALFQKILALTKVAVDIAVPDQNGDKIVVLKGRNEAHGVAIALNR